MPNAIFLSERELNVVPPPPLPSVLFAQTKKMNKRWGILASLWILVMPFESVFG